MVPVYVSSVADEAPSLGSSIGCISPTFDVNLLERVVFKPFRTVKSMPFKFLLGFLALDAVVTCPSDDSSRLQLHILPYCVLVPFFAKNRSERRSGSREQCQSDSISTIVSSWRDPDDKLCLALDHSTKVPPALY